MHGRNGEAEATIARAGLHVEDSGVGMISSSRSIKISVLLLRRIRETGANFLLLSIIRLVNFERGEENVSPRIGGGEISHFWQHRRRRTRTENERRGTTGKLDRRDAEKSK